MATNNKPVPQVSPKDSNKAQASSHLPRQQTGYEVKTHPPKKKKSLQRQKTRSKSTTIFVLQSPNPDGSKTPSSLGANRGQGEVECIEHSLAANNPTNLAFQRHGLAMYSTLTHGTGTSCPSPTKKASFLLLPPELRWQIYQELFHPHRVEILRRKNNSNKSPESARYRLCYHELVPRDAQSQQIPNRGDIPAFKPLPASLIFTCRVIYRETVHLLYSTTQFIFKCTKTTARFLKTTSKDSQAAISHVELYHIMYNEPRLTEFREYKFRSDRAWYIVCDEMSQNFENLRVMHVDMTVHDWPIYLEIGERWSLPLLAFGEHGHQLDFAHILLRMPRFSKEKLEFVARSMEEKIMKPESFQIREDDRLARKLMGPVTARKVLRLSF